MNSITSSELHATSGEPVWKSGAGRTPVMVTDRGEPGAVLANPALLRPRRRTRTRLPEFAAPMARPPGADAQADLDAVRGKR